MRILVTGANGFVGGILTRWLAAAGHEVVGTVRRDAGRPGWMEWRETGDLVQLGDFAPLVAGVDAVVHLVARVHMMRETASDPEAAYHEANAAVTDRLATAAAAAGVARFLFLSSVKVNGEATDGTPFDETMAPAPQDAYGRSKLAAERALGIRADRAMAVTILRTPLIYGPGVGANFHALMRLCATRLPLPLDGITGNRRSLLFAGNLAHAVERVLTIPASTPGTFLLCDGEDLSTADLVRRLRLSLGRPTVPLPVPPGLLRAAAGAAGTSAAVDRLCGSLQIDAGRFRGAFDWRPRFTVGQGFAATASRFRAAG